MMTTETEHGIISELTHLLGEKAVISHPDELLVYECDGFTISRNKPIAVVFPENTQQVSAIMTCCARHHVPVIPRGGATGLAGGVTPVMPSVMVSTARMNKIHEINLRDRWALVDAGVPNLALSGACAQSHLHFAPDPSSQRAATIGGNVATNAGGVHTLKHGVTTNHILGVEVVLSDGSVHVIGGPRGSGQAIGPDIVGLLCGGEGTLAFITRVWCRLTPKPKAFRTAVAVFNTSADACNTVAQIIAAGIIPAALEMIDKQFIRIVEEAFKMGFPLDAQAILFIEVDGIDLGLDEQMAEIERIAKNNSARSFESGSDPQRRADIWAARKRAFGALGRFNISYCTQDACVPRSKLPDVLAKIYEVAAKYELLITNCFHAGDGNVHPVLCFNEADHQQVRKAIAASGEILRYCISLGGAVTGEHGVGLEKLPYMRDMFPRESLEMMHRLRNALVTHDMLNPLKHLPRDGVEIDLLSPGRKVPQ